ncbi:hypothetical protein IscW_ISCW017913, partial [Ixodes scapularis]
KKIEKRAERGSAEDKISPYREYVKVVVSEKRSRKRPVGAPASKPFEKKKKSIFEKSHNERPFGANARLLSIVFNPHSPRRKKNKKKNREV